MEILIKPFFLPVVRPFGKNVKIIPKPWKLKETLDYYKDLESKGVKITTTLSTSASPLGIRIQNHTTKHPAPDDDPVSTIFSMTSGFVSLIPEGLVLRVWTNDFKELTKTPRKPSRANRIVYGNIDLNSIKEKIKIQIEKLGLGVLKESAGATSTQDPQELANKFLERFMKGEVEVFVFAGTVLGRATEIPNTPDAMLTLQTFFDPAGAAPPERVVPEDLIDNAFRWQQLHAYMGHPLLTALNAPVSITFQSRFFIWDTGKYEYVPLVSTEVELFVGPDLSNIPNLDQIADLKKLAVAAEDKFLSGGKVITDGTGRISWTPVDSNNLPVTVPAHTKIRFRYHTEGKTIGGRKYDAYIETDSHQAREYAEGTNNKLINKKNYKAKYEIGPKYVEFMIEIALKGGHEQFEQDRGNSNWTDEVFFTAYDMLDEFIPAVSHRELFRHIKQFEARYKADELPDPQKTFNLLVEGDSWLNYPVAFNDIYSHLDRILWEKKKDGIIYNRLPLQHYGDRADQMFFAASPAASRQWNFTLDFLTDYKIDLIFASGGGNDMAEPGIANDTDDDRFKKFLAPGYFDPFEAAKALAPPDMKIAASAIRQSFAVLLNNHLWHSYFNSTPPFIAYPLKDEAAMSATLAALLTDVEKKLGKSFGPADLQLQESYLQEIGEQVIEYFPDTISSGSPEDLLIKAVFDPNAFKQRYEEVRGNWKILLEVAKKRGIPVLTHTYCYPLFNEKPTSAFGKGNWRFTGPWFGHRFREAKIMDRRIRKICLKVILDKFVLDVLEPLKKDYYPFFDYVDTRRLNSSVDIWRDEMHLRGSGFLKIARQIHSVIAGKTPSVIGKFDKFFEG